MAGHAGQRTDGAGGRESILADALWHRPGEDGGGLWHTGRKAKPSRTAGLARHGIHPQGLEHQGRAENDGHERDLSAISESDALVIAKLPGKSAPGARAASATFGGDDPRPGAGDEWIIGRKDRRSFGETLPAERALERIVLRSGLRAGQRQEPL